MPPSVKIFEGPTGAHIFVSSPLIQDPTPTHMIYCFTRQALADDPLFRIVEKIYIRVERQLMQRHPQQPINRGSWLSIEDMLQQFKVNLSMGDGQPLPILAPFLRVPTATASDPSSKKEPRDAAPFSEYMTILATFAEALCRLPKNICPYVQIDLPPNDFSKEETRDIVNSSDPSKETRVDPSEDSTHSAALALISMSQPMSATSNSASTLNSGDFDDEDTIVVEIPK